MLCRPPNHHSQGEGRPPDFLRLGRRGPLPPGSRGLLGELGGSVCLNRARGRSSQAAHLSLFSGIFIFFWRVSSGILGESWGKPHRRLPRTCYFKPQPPPSLLSSRFQACSQEGALQEASLCLSLSSRHEAAASAITQSGEGAGSWVRILTSKGGQLALEPPEPARSCSRAQGG